MTKEHTHDWQLHRLDDIGKEYGEDRRESISTVWACPCGAVKTEVGEIVKDGIEEFREEKRNEW